MIMKSSLVSLQTVLYIGAHISTCYCMGAACVVLVMSYIMMSLLVSEYRKYSECHDRSTADTYCCLKPAHKGRATGSRLAEPLREKESPVNRDIRRTRLGARRSTSGTIQNRALCARLGISSGKSETNPGRLVHKKQ